MFPGQLLGGRSTSSSSSMIASTLSTVEFGERRPNSSSKSYDPLVAFQRLGQSLPGVLKIVEVILQTLLGIRTILWRHFLPPTMNDFRRKNRDRSAGGNFRDEGRPVPVPVHGHDTRP